MWISKKKLQDMIAVAISDILIEFAANKRHSYFGDSNLWPDKYNAMLESRINALITEYAELKVTMRLDRFLSSEEFFDNIVARINKKQLNAK